LDKSKRGNGAVVFEAEPKELIKRMVEALKEEEKSLE
jgi:hypothetical protein